MPEDQQIVQHIARVATARFTSDNASRREALREYLAAARPDVDPDTAEALAAHAPALLPSLYTRWARMFASRMFETVPREQIETLCDGSEDNDAALSLAFIMFLESARMERQIAEDLSCLDALAGGRGAGAAAEFVLAQREAAAKDRDRNQRRKAAAYKARRQS
ncbi:MAG: hypothetical protein PWQ57_3119 [Desulfovibrionales bacterium]|nr:hypothetical protein [Desulfovibrionales bacterium]